MKRLIANKHMLHVFKNCKPSVRKAILKSSSVEFIKTLCEICLNVLNGNLKISEKLKKKLKFYKNILRSVVSRKFNLKAKRKIFIQRGGAFLPLLISVLLSSVIGKVINSSE